MKKSIALTALFVAFTIICFVLNGSLSEDTGIFMRVWYIVTLLLWCVLAVKWLMLSLKLAKLRRIKREGNRRKEKKK